MQFSLLWPGTFIMSRTIYNYWEVKTSGNTTVFSQRNPYKPTGKSHLKEQVINVSQNQYLHQLMWSLGSIPTCQCCVPARTVLSQEDKERVHRDFIRTYKITSVKRYDACCWQQMKQHSFLLRGYQQQALPALGRCPHSLHIWMYHKH